MDYAPGFRKPTYELCSAVGRSRPRSCENSNLMLAGIKDVAWGPPAPAEVMSPVIDLGRWVLAEQFLGQP